MAEEVPTLPVVPGLEVMPAMFSMIFGMIFMILPILIIIPLMRTLTEALAEGIRS